LVVNVKTAKTLDLTVPPKLLAAAGEVEIGDTCLIGDPIRAKHLRWEKYQSPRSRHCATVRIQKKCALRGRIRWVGTSVAALFSAY
jgi:hypothetical protein